jgi:hypothetical protein
MPLPLLPLLGSPPEANRRSEHGAPPLPFPNPDSRLHRASAGDGLISRAKRPCRCVVFVPASSTGRSVVARMSFARKPVRSQSTHRARGAAVAIPQSRFPASSRLGWRWPDQPCQAAMSMRGLRSSIQHRPKCRCPHVFRSEACPEPIDASSTERRCRDSPIPIPDSRLLAGDGLISRAKRPCRCVIFVPASSTGRSVVARLSFARKSVRGQSTQRARGAAVAIPQSRFPTPGF